MRIVRPRLTVACHGSCCAQHTAHTRCVGLCPAHLSFTSMSLIPSTPRPNSTPLCPCRSSTPLKRDCASLINVKEVSKLSEPACTQQVQHHMSGGPSGHYHGCYHHAPSNAHMKCLWDCSSHVAASSNRQLTLGMTRCQAGKHNKRFVGDPKRKTRI